MPQIVFQGLAEQPEEPHVADQMQPAGVQEQAAEHGGQQLQGLVGGDQLGVAQFGGHRPLVHEQGRGRIRAEVQLIEKNGHIDRNQSQRDPGPALLRRRPADGDHRYSRKNVGQAPSPVQGQPGAAVLHHNPAHFTLPGRGCPGAGAGGVDKAWSF